MTMLHVNLSNYSEREERKRLSKTDKKKASDRRMSEILKLGKEAAKFSNIAWESLVSKRRDRRLALVRWMCFKYLMSKWHTSSEIGKKFNRDHTTILYGVDKIDDFIRLYPEIREDYNALKVHLDAVRSNIKYGNK